MLGVAHWVRFLSFWRKLLNSTPHSSQCLCFRGIFVRAVSLLEGGNREATVTPILKGPYFSSITNYHQIIITPVSSKVLGRMMSVRLGRFRECSGVLQMHPVCLSEWPGHLWCSIPIVYDPYIAKCAGELGGGQQGLCRLTSCCAAFDKVNHRGIPYKLCCVGIRSSVFLYCHSFYKIDHSSLWQMVVEVN